MATQGAVFGALAAWVLLLGAAHKMGTPDFAPGPQLALGVAAAAYFLRTGKGVALPRALGLAGLGLLGGTLVGAAVESWLQARERAGPRRPSPRPRHLVLNSVRERFALARVDPSCAGNAWAGPFP